jgi:methylated-DNA-[protein]-cysteine S-methyltransferase
MAPRQPTILTTRSAVIAGLGRVTVVASPAGLVSAAGWGADPAIAGKARTPAGLAVAEAALEALRGYVQGRGPGILAALPLDLPRLPPFTTAVLRALVRLPAEERTYADLAARAGRPGAARAVGRAMATNPLPFFIPCHRVRASQGPGGYSCAAADPMAAKRLLLRLDGLA